MKRPPAKDSGNQKALLSASPAEVQGWKREQRPVAPSSTPLWSRYVDSRMKTFGSVR